MVASKVLVLNAGSSSLKFKLFDQAKGGLTAVVSGLIERIGDTSNSQACSSGMFIWPVHPDSATPRACYT